MATQLPGTGGGAAGTGLAAAARANPHSAMRSRCLVMSQEQRTLRPRSVQAVVALPAQDNNNNSNINGNKVS